MEKKNEIDGTHKISKRSFASSCFPSEQLTVMIFVFLGLVVGFGFGGLLAIVFTFPLFQTPTLVLAFFREESSVGKCSGEPGVEVKTAAVSALPPTVLRPDKEITARTNKCKFGVHKSLQ